MGPLRPIELGNTENTYETRTSYYEEKHRKGKQMVNQIFKLAPILSII